MYYLNFVEEKIWRNNFKMGGWEVVKDEEFQSPGTAFCKKHVSQIEKIMFNHPPLKKKKNLHKLKILFDMGVRVDKRFEGYSMD